MAVQPLSDSTIANTVWSAGSFAGAKIGYPMERTFHMSLALEKSPFPGTAFVYQEPWTYVDEVIRVGVAGLQEATALAPASGERSTEDRRITGPVKFVKSLLDTWHLPPEAAGRLLGFEASDADYVKDVLRGDAPLRGRDAKDRVVHLFQIRRLLFSLFRDEAVENDWLREARDALGGKSPLDLLLDGSMEDLLLTKEYVEFVAGW